jgi:hypothetical protein
MDQNELNINYQQRSLMKMNNFNGLKSFINDQNMTLKTSEEVYTIDKMCLDIF